MLVRDWADDHNSNTNTDTGGVYAHAGIGGLAVGANITAITIKKFPIQ